MPGDRRRTDAPKAGVAEAHTGNHGALVIEAKRQTPVYTEQRLGKPWSNRLKALLGLPSQRRLARAALKIDIVRHWEQELSRVSDGALVQLGRRLRGRARGGETLEQLLPETFGAI